MSNTDNPLMKSVAEHAVQQGIAAAVEVVSPFIGEERAVEFIQESEAWNSIESAIEDALFDYVQWVRDRNEAAATGGES